MAQNRSSLVRIRGLPWGSGQQEVQDFFYPLRLVPEDPIALINGPAGRRTGEAYVRFENNADAERALCYNKAMIGKRYIEVFPASEADLNASVQRQGSSRRYGDGIIRCRGLPFRITATEVADFFADYGISEDHVMLGVHSSGRYIGGPNGEAWVKFRDEDLAKRAYKEKNLKCIGNRYVELYPSSEAERQQFQGSPSWGKMRSWGPSDDLEQKVNSDSGSGNCNTRSFAAKSLKHEQELVPEPNEVWLRARGLPYSASEQDVADFFHGHGVDAVDVNINLGDDGSPTGEAYIRFTTKRAANTAQAALHRKWLGKRYVEIFPPGQRSTPTAAQSQQAVQAGSVSGRASRSAKSVAWAQAGQSHRKKGRSAAAADMYGSSAAGARTAHTRSSALPRTEEEEQEDDDENEYYPSASASSGNFLQQPSSTDEGSFGNLEGITERLPASPTEEACEVATTAQFTASVTRTPTSSSAASEVSEIGEVTDEDDSCVGVSHAASWCTVPVDQSAIPMESCVMPIDPCAMHMDHCAMQPIDPSAMPADPWQELPPESMNMLLGDNMVYPMYDQTFGYMNYGMVPAPYMVMSPYGMG